MRPEEFFEPDELEIYRLIEAAQIPAYDEGPDPFADDGDLEYNAALVRAQANNIRRKCAIENLAAALRDCGIRFDNLLLLETNMRIFYDRIGRDCRDDLKEIFREWQRQIETHGQPEPSQSEKAVAA